ncbi:MAG TPA: hypothetical protein VHG92_07360 [Afifellaceae bacterium]|nr:hypothetical protein [Afifellaceae bacterium]
MTSRKKAILLSTWAVPFILGSLSAAVFIQGIVRDHRIGEPRIGLDLSAEAGWLETSFRVVGADEYRLFLSSVNHHRQLVGRRFDGRLQVQVIDPDGRLVLDRVYDATALDYAVPSNYGDRTLDVLVVCPAGQYGLGSSGRRFSLLILISERYAAN